MIGVNVSGCRGWYHDAPGSRGVLLCGPQSFEELCARPACHVLAEKLAGAGMPVLRIDLWGTADSPGSEDDPDLVASWRRCVTEAAGWLTNTAGVDEVVLVGMRLGSLLAGLEAPNIANLKGLALLAPVSGGRQHLRQMTALSGIMAPPGSRDLDAASAPNDEISICGFRTTAAMIEDLKPLTIDAAGPSSLQRSPPLDVLLLQQKGTSTSSLQQFLAQASCRTTVLPFFGYDEMMCDPTAARLPSADLDAVVAWVSSLGPQAHRRAVRDIQPEPVMGDDWIETAVTFSSNPPLSGVLCAPRGGTPVGTPLIFTNGGMNYHIGWARQTVRIARELAGRGVTSLRYDAPGIGDACFGDSRVLPLYNDIASNALTAAIDFLARRGAPKVMVTGSCSGAYTAFHVARKDARVAKAAIVNLQCFEWTPAIGYEIEMWADMRRAEIAAQRALAEQSLSRAPSKGRLGRYTLSGTMRFAGRIVKRLLRSKFINATSRAESEEVGWYRQISERGSELMMVYSRGDLGLLEFENKTGNGGAAITGLPGISLRFIEKSDHNFTPRQAQNDYLALLLELAAPQHQRCLESEPARSTSEKAL